MGDDFKELYAKTQLELSKTKAELDEFINKDAPKFFKKNKYNLMIGFGLLVLGFVIGVLV